MDGLIAGARFIASPNCDARPAGILATLLVIHCISLPPGCFQGDAIERFFTNSLEPDRHPFFPGIAPLRVSAHFVIRRNGELLQFVPINLRAWHAGESCWRGRKLCNDYSVGVELEGTDSDVYSDEQYMRLTQLVRAVRVSLPISDFAAHSDVAPRRKSDPGALFDWHRFLCDVARG